MIPFVILTIEDDDDREFMTELYYKYERLMWSEIRKALKGHSEAEDVFQTSLVKLVQKVKVLRGLENRHRVNYIISTVKNASIDVLRARGKAPMDSMNDEEWVGRIELQTEEDLEELVFRRDSVEKLELVWPYLNERSRYLLEGKYFVGLSTQDMGKVLGITADSVRVELSRARRKVRALLAEHFEMTEL